VLLSFASNALSCADFCFCACCDALGGMTCLDAPVWGTDIGARDTADWDLLDSSLSANAFPVWLNGAQAFPASGVSPPLIYYDIGASVSVCMDLELLADVVLLAVPLQLGGIGDGVLVTHRGFLRFLPRDLALCYYSRSACASVLVPQWPLFEPHI